MTQQEEGARAAATPFRGLRLQSAVMVVFNCWLQSAPQGGAGHGKHLPTLRVQLCTLNSRGAVQSKPRWLSPPRTSRQCPHEGEPSCRHRPWRPWTRSGGAHTTSNQGLYMDSQTGCRQELNFLSLSSPPSPSPSSRSWVPLHALWPAPRQLSPM